MALSIRQMAHDWEMSIANRHYSKGGRLSEAEDLDRRVGTPSRRIEFSLRLDGGPTQDSRPNNPADWGSENRPGSVSVRCNGPRLVGMANDFHECCGLRQRGMKYRHPWTHPKCPKVAKTPLGQGKAVDPLYGDVDDWWQRIHLRECRKCRRLHTRLQRLCNLGHSQVAVAYWNWLSEGGKGRPPKPEPRDRALDGY